MYLYQVEAHEPPSKVLPCLAYLKTKCMRMPELRLCFLSAHSIPQFNFSAGVACVVAYAHLRTRGFNSPDVLTVLTTN